MLPAFLAMRAPSSSRSFYWLTLIVGIVGTVAQLIIVLAIFFAQAEVATAIENMNTQGSVTAAYIKEKDR